MVRNKSVPGVDGVTVAEFKGWLGVHWQSVKALLEGGYLPRPGRSAAQALKQTRTYVGEGRRWVVDLDLEQSFDRVNHDVRMSRVARRVHDARVLKLIGRFLAARMMQEGPVTARTEGTPQGGRLSPLLSNILFTDLDRELAGPRDPPRVAAAALALCALAAVKASSDSGDGTAVTRARRPPSLARCPEWARSVVECRGLAHEHGAAAHVLHTHGAGLAGGYPTAAPGCPLNPCMRNRTCGGVGGRGAKAPRPPDRAERKAPNAADGFHPPFRPALFAYHSDVEPEPAAVYARPAAELLGGHRAAPHVRSANVADPNLGPRGPRRSGT